MHLGGERKRGGFYADLPWRGERVGGFWDRGVENGGGNVWGYVEVYGRSVELAERL